MISAPNLAAISSAYGRAISAALDPSNGTNILSYILFSSFLRFIIQWIPSDISGK
jgi:hypothetical protein